jgi:hypothetical protein
MIYSIDKLAELSGFKKSAIKRFMNTGVFKEGLQYFKSSERKIIFDENALNIAALKGERENDNIHKEQDTMGLILQKWREDKKVYATKRHKREQEAC